MRSFLKKLLIALCLLGVLVAVAVLYTALRPEAPTEAPTPPLVERSIVGYSVEGRAIEAYTYGSGATDLLFVGGIHGGYEWNSVLLAYQLIDHLAANPRSVPAELSVTIIPAANPDGLYKVVGKEGRFSVADVKESGVAAASGRFNANHIDLNRNFDCKWKPTSTWRGSEVSAGATAFSEPESKVIRDVVQRTKPHSVVFWHSQANAVYASECEAGILPKTREVMSAYATAAGYPAVDVFDAYEVTGDAEGWLASIGVPAITVELSTHETIEWERNLAGVQALFSLFAPAANAVY